MQSVTMHPVGGTSEQRRLGGWLPDQEALEAWLAGFASKVSAKTPAEYHPVIKELAELIETDPIIRMYATQMIHQVPKAKKYRDHHLQSVRQMLDLMNEVITTAPEFDTTELVGCPLNAVLDWAMGTTAGFALFRNEALNAVLKRILGEWCEFLSSPESLYVLNDGPKGWMSPEAAKAMSIDQYRHDPHAAHWGFQSWNDFFTRRFKDGQRPIDDPDDDKVVVSACESTPYAIATNVKRLDRFWIKAQPYSLQDMMDNDPSVDQFVGGTVYQAFLSALNYHRWHAPVGGTVRKAWVVDGTYYSEADVEGEDPGGPNNSQGYITQVATRAILQIEADDPAIGLMAVVFVGMAEISSCVFLPQVAPGYKITKGEEVGHFQYGGSTHCLVFRPGAIESFELQALPQPHNPHPPLVELGTRIATAAS